MWSWILTVVGLTGFILAGKKIWWCWYINIACQGLWFAYALITEQYGFLAAAIAYTYTVVFSRNAYKWTKKKKANKFDGGILHISKPLTLEQREAFQEEFNLRYPAKSKEEFQKRTEILFGNKWSEHTPLERYVKEAFNAGVNRGVDMASIVRTRDLSPDFNHWWACQRFHPGKPCVLGQNHPTVPE